jgi:HD superfamily phosphohydrolase
MYWQVYLHKTVLVAEYMLVKLLKRAKEVSMDGEKLFASPSLSFFLKNKINREKLNKDKSVLNHFTQLDDSDIFGAMKVWIEHSDKTLSTLSKSLVNRRLFKIEIQNEPFSDTYISAIRDKTAKIYRLSEAETDYFVFYDETSNYAYTPGPDKINILFKDGKIRDIGEAADELNISLLAKPVTKYFICYPKDIT